MLLIIMGDNSANTWYVMHEVLSNSLYDADIRSSLFLPSSQATPPRPNMIHEVIDP